jgi:hypothetical protein
MFPITLDQLLTNNFITLCQGHLLEFQKKEMQVAIGCKMNPKIVNEEFMSLVDYIKYKSFEQDNKKLEAQWATKYIEKMLKRLYMLKGKCKSLVNCMF